MSNSGRRASVRCAALGDCPADAGGCLRGELGDEVRRRRSAISRSGSYSCAPKRLLCASPPHSGSPPRRRGPARSVWTFRAEPALADAIAYTLYERQPIAGAHRRAPPRRSACERTHSARLSAVRVSWKAHGVHQGHLALNGSRPCSIPGECLRQGQRREPQLIGPSASSKVRTVVLRRITGTTAWTLCIFSARVLASSRKGPGAPRRLRTM